MQLAVAQRATPIYLGALDSHLLLTVVLAGDQRSLSARPEALLPLGSRMRVRLALEATRRRAAGMSAAYAAKKAGATKLMTPS